MDPFASRRRALLERLVRERAVAFFRSAPELLRNADTEHDYRQDSDLYYLTGLDEPDSALILSGIHPEHRSVLFVRPRDPEREIWVGARVGVDDAPKRFGVDVAYSVAELGVKLPDHLQNARRLIARLGREPSQDRELLGALETARGRSRTGNTWPTEIVDPVAVVHEMRLIKDDVEIETTRSAARISAEGHLRAMREAAPGKREFELEAALSFVFRSRGAARHAFQPIVASGPNATVLHYVRNDRTILDGDLVLIDAGCELDYYAADISRTFPANGRFSPAQRRIYEIVLAAQLAAIEATRPGTTVDAIHQRVCEVIADGLLDCGLLTGDRAEILGKQLYKRFFPHRTSHWLGMDVHDVGRYYVEPHVNRPLAPGMILTIEPGLYIPTTGDLAREEFRGIGVRIEDDVLVTPAGNEVLTGGVPKSIDDVEAACRG